MRISGDSKQRIPNISAIIVGLDEGHLLNDALASANFCQQLIFVDLESTDDSIEIAQQNGAEIVKHPRVPAVEIIHHEIIPQISTDWVLIMDPDERIDPTLSIFLIENQNILLDSELGAVYAPITYYFKNKKLIGTPWGGDNSRLLLAHKNRFTFSKGVHSGRNLLPNFKLLHLDKNSNGTIHHYWMQSWSQLLKKHLRYLDLEGHTRYSQGKSTSTFEILISPLKQFHISYFKCNGYKDGITGLLLSCFWSWYQTAALLKLFKFQRKVQVDELKY